MRVTFLGTGTSEGVPIINCDCPVCTSDNPKNKRMRCSVMIEVDSSNILIDTPTDMRQQLLAYPFRRIDAILYTHAHADHIFGLDDLRHFNYIQNQVIPVFSNADTIDRIKTIFGYALNEGQVRPGIPNINVHIVNEKFNLGSTEIIPVPLLHGQDKIFGYRIGNFAYCTDVNHIPESSYKLLRHLDVLVIGALRERKHARHFNLDEAISETGKIKSKKTFFTHVSHLLDHDKHGRELPPSCSFAYDGLSIEI
jgi:phosphoribosyl 1,2-cyclic phosphate phosphodiesterase